MTNVPLTADTPGPPGAYAAVLDVRSPGEFAEDRVPGAVNLPVLDDAERAAVGTLYRDDPFAARKVGAALVARNIARHLDGPLRDAAKDFRPLVYCWRGGMRSAAMATVLAQVGWRVTVLRGGYQTYRTHVRGRLDEVPPRLDLRLLAGSTGSGKTLVLHRLAGRGAQVLDLEGLAKHRGSVLGGMEEPQPSQKFFESLLSEALDRFDPARPVWVEAESNRIGDRYVPAALWARMRLAGGVELRVPAAGRVRHLMAEYAHLIADPERFKEILRKLQARRGVEKLGEWFALIDAGEWEAVVGRLLAEHYDPGYATSLGRCFPHVTDVRELADVSDERVGELVDGLLTSDDDRPREYAARSLPGE